MFFSGMTTRRLDIGHSLISAWGNQQCPLVREDGEQLKLRTIFRGIIKGILDGFRQQILRIYSHIKNHIYKVGIASLS